jgi:tetratricopeptide (TPR) repeat protein
MKGPGIRRDELIHGASLLDITPTLLPLFGLPVGADMDGKPLIAAFEMPPQVQTIASWEDLEGADGRLPADRRLDPLAAKAAMDQLAALGYVERPGEDQAESVNRTVRELQYNLAQAYRDAGRDAQALDIFRELHQQDRDEFRFALQRAWTCFALKRLDEMQEVVDDLNGRRRQVADDATRCMAQWRDEIKCRVEQRKASPPPDEGAAKTPLLTPDERAEISLASRLQRFHPEAIDFLASQLLLARGDYEGALRLLAQAEKDNSGRPGLHIQIGEAYLGLKQWEDARRSFGKAQSLDPDNPHAHLGLCRSLLPLRKNRLAAKSALATLQRMYNYPLAHYCLGVALSRLRQPSRAVDAFRMALTLNPNFAEAHRQLARLYRRAFQDLDLAREHLRQAREIESQAALTPSDASGPDVAATETAAPGLSRTDLAPIHLSVVSRREVVPWTEWTPDSTTDERWVTIVAGLPRSGTSMLMQMLHAGGLPVLTDGQRTPDSDNPRGYLEFEPAKRLHLDNEWLEQAQGKAVKLVAQLVPNLPGRLKYRILLIQRDIQEVLASQKTMLERIGGSTAAGPSKALQREYARHLRIVDAWLGEQTNVSTMRLSYHEVLHEPAVAARAINHFLGGALDAPRMIAAIDQNLHRQRAVSV